jgi:nucleoside-diphosphate-sugar epimerase
MQFVYVKDLVWAALRVLEKPQTVGHAFNISNARPVTQAEMLEALARAAGKQTQVIRVPRERILRAGGNAMGPNLYFGVYFDVPPITMIIAKAQRVLNLKPTTLDAGLKETYRWYARHHKRPQADYGFEDRLLGAPRPAAARVAS